MAFNNSHGYFENITFQVWMKSEGRLVWFKIFTQFNRVHPEELLNVWKPNFLPELCECPKIEIRGKRVSVIRPVLKKEREPSEVWITKQLLIFHCILAAIMSPTAIQSFFFFLLSRITVERFDVKIIAEQAGNASVTKS